MAHGLMLAIAVLTAAATAAQQSGDAWVSTFDVDIRELGPTGRNSFFILEPGHRAVLESGSERLVITVLDETKTVDRVSTRVVEERETQGGKLVEISRNYFAISSRTRDVYYFGEQVDIYRNGKVVGHEGAWESGQNGARFGLMMPADPQPSQKYYQEIAPGIAMDRATIVSLRETIKTPARIFSDCLKIEETTPLEAGAREYKFYARGVGLIQDGPLKLTQVTAR